VDRKTLQAMFSNFAPQRPKTGWGRRGPEDPIGFMPGVNEFDNIESIDNMSRRPFSVDSVSPEWST